MLQARLSTRLLIAAASAFFVFLGFPSASSAVQLGPDDVPKHQLVVYILIGHSNMAGWSEMADDVAHPRGWHFKLPEKIWTPAKAPLNPTPMGDGSHGGPGMPFVKEMTKQFPEHYIGVLQNAAAGATARWSWADKNRRYLRGSPIYDETIAAAREVSKQATLGGIICMLGWVESIISTSSSETNEDADFAKTFSDDVQQMVSNIRADLEQPELPFLIGKYQESAPTKPPLRSIVIDELAKIPGKVPFSAIIDSEGPYVDKSHYTYEGYVNWAKAAASIIANRGWFPDERNEPGADVGIATDGSVVSERSPDLSVPDLSSGGTRQHADDLALIGGCGLANMVEPGDRCWAFGLWLLVFPLLSSFRSSARRKRLCSSRSPRGITFQPKPTASRRK